MTHKGLCCLLPGSIPWSYNPGFPSVREDHTPGEMQTTREKCGRSALTGTQTLLDTPLIKASFWKTSAPIKIHGPMSTVVLIVVEELVCFCTSSLPEINKTYRAGRELVFRLHEENALVHSAEGTQGPWWGMELQACVGGRKTFFGYKTQSDLQAQKQVKAVTFPETVACYYIEASSLVN